jgi:hypothetical protein
VLVWHAFEGALCEFECRYVHGNGVGVVLPNLEKLIHGEVGNGLRFSGDGPKNFDAFDLRGLAQTDFLAQGVGSKAATGTDGSTDHPLAIRGLDENFDSSAERDPIRFHTFEFESEPMIAMSGIGKEDIAIKIAFVGSSDGSINILSAVII